MPHSLKIIIITFILLLAPTCKASATPEYAADTSQDCSYCHVNPLGGGELTRAGEDYQSKLQSAGTVKTVGPVMRIVRLFVGYFHILAGVIWFGTIFYVHIVLKPAYASAGLPRSELALGWAGIVIVGVTGTLLTISRMPTLHAFVSTKFGILLTIKIALYLVMAGTAALVTFVIGPMMKARREAAKAAAPAGEPGRYTLEALKQFDGKDGRRAMVAVDGVVYDLSGSRMWKTGKHAGRHLSGEDMTGSLKQAPHGPDKLDTFPKAGVIVASDEPSPAERPKKAFYALAYMNLGLVFVILFIVAVWRWG